MTSAATSAPSAGTDNLLGRLDRADITPTDVFAALLGDELTPEAFFMKHWEKEPLHIQRRSPAFYRGLFSKAAFDSHVRRAADTMQYGFDMNICVCSAEGKKIDMNPPKQKGKNGSSAKASVPPAPSAKPSKSAKAAPSTMPAASSKPAHKPSAAARAAIAESEGVQTMTIAEALALASASKAKLKPQAPPQAEEDESEEEAEEAMENSGGGGAEEDEAMDEGEDEEENEEEELLDGTSVSTIKQYAPVTFDAYDRLYNSGCTVQALQPQQYTRPMHTLVAHLEDLFSGLVGANCYLTPANSQGLAPHHDDVEVFVLQLEGTKAWKLYEPKMTLPREHSGDFAREELDEPMQVVELQPGDLMYLPRGVIHEARTDSVASSHMTISVYQKTSFFDLLSTLLPRALEAAFYAVEEGHEFRRGLPVGYPNWMGTGAVVESDADMPSEVGLSPAAPLSTRSTLRSALFTSINNLVEKLKGKCEEVLDECVDEMAEDFVNSRLPPPSSKTAKKNPFSLSSSKVDVNDRVRLVHASAVRMVVVPASEEEGEQGDDEDDGAAHLILTHSLSNSSAHHLDGRFPPPSEEELRARQLQLPVYYAPALTQLMRAGRSRSYTSISSLRLELDDMLNAEGEAPTEEEQHEAKRELVQTLLAAGLLEKWEKEQPKMAAQQKSSAPSAAASSKPKKPLTAGQLLKQKANTASAFAQALASAKIGGTKRPASEVTSSPAAAAASSSTSHKKPKHSNGNGHKAELACM